MTNLSDFPQGAQPPFHVVIVEDDADINDLLKLHFESSGEFLVTTVHSGADAMASIVAQKTDVVLLDIMLPGRFGTDILKEIRQTPALANLPVLLLTARNREDDKITGFELGADDYVTKPFSPREVVLRTKSLVKRTRAQETLVATDVVKIGDLSLHPDEHRAFVGTSAISLTGVEFKFLYYLARRVGRVIARERLLKDVWEYSGELNTRTIDTHVKRLRQKLGNANLIETIHGVGYRLNDCTT